MLLPLVRHILTRFVWMSDCNSAHRLGQSKRGCCSLLCVVSTLDSFGCQTVTLHIVLASPNVVAASSCASYPCSIRFGVRLYLYAQRASSWPDQTRLTRILTRSFGCQIVTLRTRRIVLASPNVSLNLFRVPATTVSIFPWFLIFHHLRTLVYLPFSDLACTFSRYMQQRHLISIGENT